MAEVQTEVKDNNEEEKVVENTENKPSVKIVSPVADDSTMDIVVNPTANLGDPKIKDIVKQDLAVQEEEGKITYDKIISGEVNQVGGKEIDFITKTLAQEGHVPSIIKIEKLLKDTPKETDVKIGGIRKGEVMSFTGLSEDQVTDLTKYATGRLRVLNALQRENPQTGEAVVQDKRIQQLLVDYYSTGQFYTEIAKRLAESGRGLTLTPVLANMAYHLVGAATDAIDLPDNAQKLFGFTVEDETFEDSWNKRSPAMAEFYQQYKASIEEGLGLSGLTTASAMNDDLKKIYIDVYGQKQYDDRYKITNPVNGKKVELPIISEELGQELLKIAFDELPIEQRIATMILENVGIGGIIAKARLYNGKFDLKKVQELRKNDPDEYSGLSNIEVLRKFNIKNASNQFTKAYHKTTANIGRRFKMVGAVDSAQHNLDRDNAVRLLDKQIEDVQIELNKSKLSTFNKNRLLNKLENLETQRTKFVFPFPRKTFFTGVFKDELVIGLGQAAGYEISRFYGFNTDAGEVIGALSTATGVPQFLIKKSLIGKYAPLTLANNAMGGALSNFASTIEMLPFIKKGTFIDRRFETLEDELGRPLTPEQKIAVEETSRILKNLDPAQREMIWNSINEYQQVRDRIVNSFKDPEKQREARRLFQLSFAHITGLAPLQALQAKASGKLSATGKNLNEAIEYQLQAENTVAAATAAINNLRKMIKDDLSVDTENREVLTSFVENFQKAADNYTLMVNENKIDYLSQLQSLKNNIIKDPTKSLPSDLITSLAEMEIKLTAGAVDNLEKKREIYINTTKDVFKQLNLRGKNLQLLRGTPEYKFQLGKYIEEVYDARDESIYLQSRLLYQDIDADGELVDISGVVGNLIDRQGKLSAKELKQFFSAEGDFFNSRSGRYLRRSMNAMAKRNLKKELGLEDDEFGVLQAYHSNPELLKGADADDYLADPSPLNMAFLYMQKSKDKGDKNVFSPFKGTVSEVEDLRRHFVNLSLRSKESNPSLSREYGDLGETVNSDLMKTAKANEILNARKEYKRLNFDPVRKGSIGQKLNTARNNQPAKEFVAENEYKYQYVTGFQPENFHDGFGKNIEKLLKKDDPDALSAIMKEKKELVEFWTADSTIPRVFDVTTELGKERLATVSQLVSASVYQHCVTARDAVIEKLPRQQRAGIAIGPDEYDFTTAERIQQLQNIFTVEIKIGPNPNDIEKVKLVDLSQIVNEEKELLNLLDVSSKARKEYKDLVDELNDKTNLLNERASAKFKIEDKGVKELEKVANIRDSEQFYKMYIEQGSPSMIATLRENYVTSRTYDGKVTEEEALNEFKQGIVYHVTEGLLKRAGKQRSENTLMGLDGKPFQLTTLTQAGQLATDLTDPNTQKILSVIGFSDEHIQHLEDLGRFFEYAQGSSLARYDIYGGVRSISPNELISRAFNLARGMVSPTYVAGEFSARILISKQQELIALAAQSKEAARILSDVLQNPKAVVANDINTLAVLLKEFAATKLLQLGAKAPSYLPASDLQAAYLESQGVDFSAVLDTDRKKQPLEKLYEEEKKSNENVQ